MIKSQAREIIRYARQHGITIGQGATYGSRRCARGILAHSVGLRTYDSSLAAALGMNPVDLRQLECGFEDWEDQFPDPSENLSDVSFGRPDHRYFKIGANVRRLAGIPSRD